MFYVDMTPAICIRCQKVVYLICQMAEFTCKDCRDKQLSVEEGAERLPTGGPEWQVSSSSSEASSLRSPSPDGASSPDGGEDSS